MTPRYEEHAPEPSLAAHVHCIWLFEGDEAGAEQAVPPDGRCELIAHGGRPYDERDGHGAWHAQPPLLFAGQLTRPLVLRSRASSASSASASSRRARGRSSTRRSPRAPTGASALDALHGEAPVAALQAALRDAGDARERVAPLSRYVAAQIALRRHRRDAAIEACVDKLSSSEGRVAMAELAALAELGERQLQRRFAEVVGISPRMLGRRRAAAPRLRGAARRAVGDVVRARPGRRLFRSPADGARLPAPARHRAFAWAARGRGLATSLGESDA